MDGVVGEVWEIWDDGKVRAPVGSGTRRTSTVVPPAARWTGRGRSGGVVPDARAAPASVGRAGGAPPDGRARRQGPGPSGRGPAGGGRGGRSDDRDRPGSACRHPGGTVLLRGGLPATPADAVPGRGPRGRRRPDAVGRRRLRAPGLAAGRRAPGDAPTHPGRGRRRPAAGHPVARVDGRHRRLRGTGGPAPSAGDHHRGARGHGRRGLADDPAVGPDTRHGRRHRRFPGGLGGRVGPATLPGLRGHSGHTGHGGYRAHRAHRHRWPGVRPRRTASPST
jgi:hypothetical protein